MNSDIVKAVQRRLADLGYYKGSIDGLAGPATAAAVQTFRGQVMLLDDRPVGITDLHALFDDGAPAAGRTSIQPATADTPWMVAAKKHLGLKEAPGAPSNPEILSWAKDLGIAYSNDGIAWCGLFVGFVMRSVVPGDALPKSPLGARAWLQYGRSVMPGYGAILVFWRGSKTGWQGHVGFYVGEDSYNYYVLGGNQSDSVSITKISKARLLGARAPKGKPFETFEPRKVQMSINGAQSTNEA